MAAGSSPRESHPCIPHAALLIACDAFNARTVAVREYHYAFCVSSPAGCYTRPAALVFLARSRYGEVMAHPPHGSAQKERIRSAYTASPLSCVAFFIKEQ